MFGKSNAVMKINFVETAYFLSNILLVNIHFKFACCNIR
jgi:hypothetical protein